MKKIFLSFLAVIILTSSIIFIFPVQAATNPQGTQVVAYYFHGTARCPTCRNMENYSQAAIEDNFKEALSLGSLKFQSVNVEEQGNQRYVNDYKLYTKSLILSLSKGGREVKFKNLDKIWEYAGNKQKFIEYVTEQVSEFMQAAQ